MTGSALDAGALKDARYCRHSWQAAADHHVIADAHSRSAHDVRSASVKFRAGSGWSPTSASRKAAWPSVGFGPDRLPICCAQP